MAAKQKQYSLVQAFSHQASATSAVDFHSQMLALCTKEGVISIVDVEEGEIVRTHHCYKYGVAAMRFFHNAEFGAVSSSAEADSAWRLWDFQANKFSAVFRGHERQVKNLEVHPVDDLVISTCSAESNLWDVRSDKVLSRFNFRCPPVFEKTNGRFFIAAPSDTKWIALYDMRKFETPYTNFRFDEIPTELAVTPDGNLLAVASEDRISTLDVNRGTLITRSTRTRSPRNLTFNWSGDLMAICVDQREVHIIKTAGLSRLQTISDHQGAAIPMFSPTRDVLVTAATGVGLWCPL